MKRRRSLKGGFKLRMTCSTSVFTWSPVNMYLMWYNKSHIGSTSRISAVCLSTCSSNSYNSTVKSKTHFGLSMVNRCKVGPNKNIWILYSYDKNRKALQEKLRIPIKWHSQRYCSSVWIRGWRRSLTKVGNPPICPMLAWVKKAWETARSRTNPASSPWPITVGKWKRWSGEQGRIWAGDEESWGLASKSAIRS